MTDTSNIETLMEQKFQQMGEATGAALKQQAEANKAVDDAQQTEIAAAATDAADAKTQAGEAIATANAANDNVDSLKTSLSNVDTNPAAAIKAGYGAALNVSVGGENIPVDVPAGTV